MSFDLDNYTDVAERIRLFYERFPDGRLTTVDWEVKDDLDGKTFVWVHAKAYRTPDDPLPGDGIAWEPVPGPTQFTRDSELMNAQTAAWGRAIVALGFDTKKIASRQEVQARNGANPDPHGLNDSRADAVAPHQMVFGFGKHKGKKVHEVPRDYLEWWLGSDSASAARNQELRAGVELYLGLGQDTHVQDDLAEIPF